MAAIFRAYDVAQDYQNVITIKVGSDTLSNGMAVVADALAGSYLDGDGATYTPAKPGAITDANVAVVAAEEYYMDDLGNRINITDPTVMTYKTGFRVRALRPALNKEYFLSADGYTGVAAVGKYLIPTASAYTWAVADDLTGNPKIAFKIEAINVKDTFVGLSAVTGVRLRAVRVLGE